MGKQRLGKPSPRPWVGRVLPHDNLCDFCPPSSYVQAPMTGAPSSRRWSRRWSCWSRSTVGWWAALHEVARAAVQQLQGELWHRRGMLLACLLACLPCERSGVSVTVMYYLVGGVV